MSQRGTVGRLVSRLTGAWSLERLAAVEEKVGAFGRTQRETLAAHGRALEALKATLPTRASAEAIGALEQRLEALQQLLQHQDRAVSEALERAQVLDEQGMGDRRFAKRIEELLRHTRPIIVGPWTGEVGFELIYWVPFVRWVVQTYGIPRERLWIVSRGGTRAWYDGIADHYVDVFEHYSPDGFRAATEDAKKQRRVGGFDAELVKRVASEHGLGRTDLLHPGMMYRLFMPFWKDLASLARLEQYSAYQRLTPQDDPVLETLPAQYVAARFYFSECFPETPANRAFVAATIEHISRQVPVVLLSTPFAVDDHRDADTADGAVHTVGAAMAPERNLAIQTAVIARARAFVGTYGGYSYLAPFCGVSSLAFYSNRSFKVQHLRAAQHIFDILGEPTVVPLDVASLPLVQLALSGGLARAR